MRRFTRLAMAVTWALGALLWLTLLFNSGITQGEAVAMDALSHLGQPYVFHRSGPDSFDCSGLVRHCFAACGMEIEHSAELIGGNGQWRTVHRPECLRTGDVVCFDTVDDRDPSDHVGIWIGGNRFVHASSTRKKVVVSELEGVYLEHFSWGKRLLCPYARATEGEIECVFSSMPTAAP